MPICIECRAPVKTLYTEYSNAADKSTGHGVRLTVCKACGKFCDKYVEHDFVVLFIDLVLIKPQVSFELGWDGMGWDGVLGRAGRRGLGHAGEGGGKEGEEGRVRRGLCNGTQEKETCWDTVRTGADWNRCTDTCCTTR
jgi:hypothetical protein